MNAARDPQWQYSITIYFINNNPNGKPNTHSHLES